MECEIVTYNDEAHRESVVELWRSVFGYDAPHNEPGLVIDRKVSVDDDLFFLALLDSEPVGTVMAGYDGHRGWIYSLAVDERYRHKGIGSKLLAHAERKLSGLGCLKINLQVNADNSAVEDFYRVHGYVTEPRISMGKRLPL